MSKKVFMDTLKAEVSKYAWARDERKLEMFMQQAASDIRSVSLTGPAMLAAFRAAGGKGKPTYKAVDAILTQGE